MTATVEENKMETKIDIPVNPGMIKLIESKRQGFAHSAEDIFWFISKKIMF